MRFLVSIVVALLPKQYRGWWSLASSADFRRATLFSGLVESVGCFGLYAVRYILFLKYRVGSVGEAAIKRGVEEALGNPYAQFGMGFTTLVEYIFSPVSMLLAYFMIEGVLRVFAAAVTEETPGTLPLYLLGWVIERTGRARADRALGERMVDEVHRYAGISYDLGIASSRPKKTWDRLMTIEFEEKFYEICGEKTGPPPRRYVYLLKLITPGKVIRGIHHYRPDEDLPEGKK